MILDRTDEQPILSVIVVSFNCRDFLSECLVSLEHSRAELPLEVIVVDNASADGSAEVVAHRFPWIELVEAPWNLGFAKANNIALARARGKHILLLNPDTLVPPGALRAAVDVLAKRPSIGMLGVKLVRADGRFDHACKRGVPTPFSAFCYFTRIARLSPNSRRVARYTWGHLSAEEEGLVEAISGAFMLVRRQAVEEVGLLDESFWLYMEDLDWCYRFWQKGWPVLYWPDVTVTHLKGASSGRHRTWRTNYAFHRGMWIFYRKHVAPKRPAPIPIVVWAGIWAKFILSVLPSLLARKWDGRFGRQRSLNAVGTRPAQSS